SGHTGGKTTGGGNGHGHNLNAQYLDSLSEEQRRVLRRKIDTLRGLEQDIESLRRDRIEHAVRALGLDMASSLNGLSAFTSARDWQSISSMHRGGEPPRLTWDMLKKAVGEEDKYQSKKNWSSTKGRGNRKAPIARRLDAEVLKKFGVYPEVQFLSLAVCDSCGRQVNAHYLKEHQEQNCAVSTHKREEKKNASAEPAAQA
ncbi:hypothetical protein EC988_008270, partial [Linderina pennispora]